MNILPGIKIPEKSDPQSLYTQVAALPFTIIGGEINICLITSKETGRWIIPKGWPKPGIPNYEMAEKEAEQEAGLIGEIEKKAIGSYTYKKKLHVFASVICKVKVYPLHVTRQLLSWPEKQQRITLWTKIADAASKVDDTELELLLTSKITIKNKSKTIITLAT